jgi:hypothetical protein
MVTLLGNGSILLAEVGEFWVFLGYQDSLFVILLLENSLSKLLRWMDLKLCLKWCLVIVYGAAQPRDKEDILIELGMVCRDQSIPLLVGGDFNLLRFSSEKNKRMRGKKWTDMFN